MRAVGGPARSGPRPRACARRLLGVGVFLRRRRRRLRRRRAVAAPASCRSASTRPDADAPTRRPTGPTGATGAAPPPAAAEGQRDDARSAARAGVARRRRAVRQRRRAVPRRLRQRRRPDRHGPDARRRERPGLRHAAGAATPRPSPRRSARRSTCSAGGDGSTIYEISPTGADRRRLAAGADRRRRRSRRSAARRTSSAATPARPSSTRSSPSPRRRARRVVATLPAPLRFADRDRDRRPDLHHRRRDERRREHDRVPLRPGDQGRDDVRVAAARARPRGRGDARRPDHRRSAALSTASGQRTRAIYVINLAHRDRAPRRPAAGRALGHGRRRGSAARSSSPAASTARAPRPPRSTHHGEDALSARVAGLLLTPVKGLRVTRARRGHRRTRGRPREPPLLPRRRAAAPWSTASGWAGCRRVVAEYSHERRASSRCDFPDGRMVAGAVELGEPVDGALLLARRCRRTSSRARGRRRSRSTPARRCGCSRADLEQGAVDRGARRHGVADLARDARRAWPPQAGAERPLDARRLRMLFEIDGVGAHEEDAWLGRPLRLGEAVIVARRPHGTLRRHDPRPRDAGSGRSTR